jgi:anaphase-promoting complex subunit 10
LLTIHFLRRVEIRAIRFYVNYTQDESYTPIAVTFSAGTGHHDLIQFASLKMNNPIGWQEVDLSCAGGGDDGRALCCWLVQMQVCENHQNGKDTHIRAIKLYGSDEHSGTAAEDAAIGEMADLIDAATLGARGNDEAEMQRLRGLTMGVPPTGSNGGRGTLGLPDFMRDPEIR